MQRIAKTGKGGNRHFKVIFLSIGLMALVGVMTASAMAPRMEMGAPGRADIIVIDGLHAFGPLERAPVVFFHDKHTEAVAQQKKDCLACHPMNNGSLSPKYRRIEETDKQNAMDAYHSGCIGCHQEYRDRNETAGPVTCGECHVQKPRIRSDWQPIGLDRSLHYRHVKANENRCERCHHQYNEQTQKLYYAKGREGACLYCHKEKTEENRISDRQASHLACIGCHRKMTEQNKDAGPIVCGGCHDPRQQALIVKVADAPPETRNQPDATLVQTHPEEAPPAEPQTRMAVVPFNHKQHEGYSDYCRTCHHAALTPCAQCHTIQGNRDGRMVKLAQAMHQPDAPMSCVGCHNRRQAKPECAGCHAGMPRERLWIAQVSCKVCHIPHEAPPNPANQDLVQSLATELLGSRPTHERIVAIDQIPENVTINHLVDQFEAVTMPHRQMVLKLADLIRDDRLAGAFHTEPTTLCRGCHHNSPGTIKPPECGACHGRTSEELNPTRPGLMAAFHEQCLKCHERMGIQKPATRDCTACHAKRASMESKY